MKENATPMTMRDTEYKKLVEPYKDEAFKAYKELVAIDSVNDPSTVTKEKPFGEGVDKALAYVASLGKTLGFEVDRCDGYATELTYGKGEKTLDIYAHCDVVPVSRQDWKHEPFAITQEGNVLYGRGTSDDKGPGLACLFAIKALLDKGRLDGIRTRVIFGGDEERGSACLEHYFHDLKKGYPTYGFSPDADYPLIYGEKSIYAYEAVYNIELDVEPFAWGDALNIVIDKASCVLKSRIEEANILAKRFAERNKDIQLSIEGNVVKVIGIPYHGSMPWNGKNAALYLLKFLGYLYDEKGARDVFDQYISGKGEAFRGDYKDNDFDCTSYNVGKVVYDGSELKLYVNLRFPATILKDDVIENVAVNTGAGITCLGGSDGFVMDKNSSFVKTLLSAYQEETGDKESQPMAIGGGTYARESRNSVAFGAQFPGRDYRMHGNDEFFPLSDFYDNMQIYAHAVDSLVKMMKEEK